MTINVNNLPDVLEGKPLTLRRLALGDAADFADMMQDADVARMTRTIPRYFPLIAAECKIMEMRAQEQRGLSFNYAITETASGSFIGVITLFRRDTDHMLEIDYHIAKPSWNDSYAFAACQRMLRAAQDHLGVQGVKADVFGDNTQSLDVLKRLGFAMSGPMTQGFSMFRLEKVPSVTLRLDLTQAAAKPLKAKPHKAELYIV